MKRVWEEGLVEAEAESGSAAHGRHREDEVWSGAHSLRTLEETREEKKKKK